jgi:ankyrin repeat protein
MFALWNQQYNTFKYLLELGADVTIHDHYDGTSAIIEACKMENDNADYVKLLLQHGANINDIEVGKRREGNSTRDSPLIAACRKGKTELVKLLVESGADLNYKNEYNQSALSYASKMSHYNIIIYLLKKGVDYSLPITYNKEQNKTYYLVDELRFYMPDLNTNEHKLKMEIVSFLRTKGIEYKDVPIPVYVTKKAKERYPDNWQQYLDKY